MSAQTNIESAQANMASAQKQLTAALAELNAVPPTPVPPPIPVATTLKGIDAGYWGAQEITDLAALKPQVIRLGTPPTGATAAWSAIGKVVLLWEGDQNGNYNSAGVQAYNAQATADAMFNRWLANQDSTYLEVLNEPGSGGQGWGNGPNAADQVSAARYCEILKLVHAKVSGLTGKKPLLIASIDGGKPGSVLWYQRMYASDQNVGSYFDIGSCHPYGKGAPGNEPWEGRWAGVEAAKSLCGKPMCVSELGWPTISETGDSIKVSEEQQGKSITLAIQKARALGLVFITIYNYRDGTGSPGYGLVRPDDSKKPAWAALAQA